MPSSLHEALIEMFRHRPSLAAELLTGPLGRSVPRYEHIHLGSGELPDLVPTEYRADAVVVLTAAAGQPVLAIVIEVQLRRDGGKRWSWPVYLATLRARLRCAVTLLVVCPTAPTARWCAHPIELGHPKWVLRPLVVGPGQIPVVADTRHAVQAPELAVLSAMAHGASPDRDGVLTAVASALSVVDDDHLALYSDVVLAALPQAARQYLEALMGILTGFEPQSEFVRRYYLPARAEGEAVGEARGEARGEAKAVLAVLDARGVDVPEPARARIAECTDLDQLDTWVRHAAFAESIDDLFD